MNRKMIFKLAISTAFIALPGVGLTELSASAASGNKSAEAQAKKAFGYARKAEKQYAKGNVDQALGYAEAAVEGDPRNHEYRALLARIYMKQGRFVAAERTLMDVMELGQADPRTIVSLALARTAQGKVDSAIALVDANRAILPASDYGLALALAGDNKRAVDVLVDAIRSNNSTARTRQNLALAYALDGRWREAQVMAVQDMPKTLADKRIVEWALYARPGAYEVRVAGLLGVKAQADSGQPVRLALNAVPSADVQVAAVEAPVDIAFAAAPVAELAAVGPAPVDVEPVVEQAVAVAVAAMPFEAPVVDGPAPVALAVAAPIIFVPGTGTPVVEQAVAVAVAAMPVEAPLIKASEEPAKAPVKLALADTAPAVTKSVSGTHLVQLGAFSSKAGAQAAWGQYVHKYGVLQGFDSASSSVTVNGKSLVRLAAMGFGSKAAADAACRSIRAKGGDCIVKSVGGEASPVRMAARKPVQVASR